MPKLLFTIDSLQAGGAERSTLETIRHLANDWHITVVYFYAKHDLKEAFEKAPCTLVYIPLQSGYKFRKGINALSELIITEKIDLVVTSLYRSGIISRLAGKLTNTPVIDTIVNDGYSAAKLAEFKGLHKLKFYGVKALDRITAGIPVRWISNSKAIADTMGAALGINKEKIRVVYRGRNTAAIPQWKAPFLAGSFRFVAAGRLVAQKGFADLIHAFAMVHSSFPEATLTIYGEGPDRSTLEELINKLNLQCIIQLPGHKPDVWKEFNDNHCFILSSHYEGLSGVLIEALITGIPIIASDISMNQEAAVSDASVAFYKVGDANDLAEKMKAFISNYSQVQQHAAATRMAAIEKYDMAHVARQYHNVLLEAVQAYKR